MTEHSGAYNYFIRMLDATGSERAHGGFDPNLLDKIFEWEREEVEKIIWTRFNHNGSGDLAILVAKLKDYDGIKLLEDRLRDGLASSEYSWYLVEVAAALYQATSVADYLDYLYMYFDAKKEYSLIALLTYIDKSEKTYAFCADVYINSDDSLIRSTSIDGILCCKGYIKNPYDLKERSEMVNLSRAFLSDDRELRKVKLARFENGEFDSIPRAYGRYKKIEIDESGVPVAPAPEPEVPDVEAEGVIDATESGVFNIFYEPENLYIPGKLSAEYGGDAAKPVIGDRVRFLKKFKGQSEILGVVE